MHNSTLQIFLAELLGTFGLVIAATGSIVYDAKLENTLGSVFVASVHFIGILIVVYLFGKYSMAHFNPAVTIGYFVAGYTKKSQLPAYFAAQIMGAFLGSIAVKFLIGDYANLGTNFPNFSYSIQVFYGIEILATILLMGTIFSVVYLKKLNQFSGIAIGGIVALDVFFFGPISGASMNPFRSLAPAVISGHFDDLWLYMTAPFIGTVIVGILFKKITKFKRME
ncbi:MAG: aquaporin [Ignavibacteriales bacterium]|nr:aquaporin [Ignavibacteriales bacterium]